MKMDITSFSTNKAELVAQIEAMKNVKIDGIDDKIGYQLAKDSKSLCVSKRGEITRNGKELRAEALQFQKDVIAHEKELISIIEPVEAELAEKIKAIDDEKEKLRRVKLLPSRHARLQVINSDVDDNTLLAFDVDQFEGFFEKKNAEFVNEQARLAQEEANKAKEKAEKELAEAMAKLKEAEKKLEEKEVAEEPKGEEVTAIIPEIIETKEEEKLSDVIEAKITKWNNFLIENGYSDENKAEFIVKTEGETRTLYRKIN